MKNDNGMMWTIKMKMTAECYSALTSDGKRWNRIKNNWAATWQNQQNKDSEAKTQISLGIRPVSSESSLSSWINLGSLATHWMHSEDSNQTGWMPRLIWVFAGRTLILLVLSCLGSFQPGSCSGTGSIFRNTGLVYCVKCFRWYFCQN